MGTITDKAGVAGASAAEQLLLSYKYWKANKDAFDYFDSGTGKTNFDLWKTKAVLTQNAYKALTDKIGAESGVTGYSAFTTNKKCATATIMTATGLASGTDSAAVANCAAKCSALKAYDVTTATYPSA